MTADGLPIIGEYKKLPNVIMATGHTCTAEPGPVTGVIAAQLAGDLW